MAYTQTGQWVLAKCDHDVPMDQECEQCDHEELMRARAEDDRDWWFTSYPDFADIYSLRDDEDYRDYAEEAYNARLLRED